LRPLTFTLEASSTLPAGWSFYADSQGQTPLAVAIKHRNENPPDARDTNPLVPEPLVRIIYRCLQKSPAARYPDAQALADDLAVLESEMPSLVREISGSQTRPGSSAASAAPAAPAIPPLDKAAHRAARRKTRRTTWIIVILGLLFIPPLYRAVKKLGEEGLTGSIRDRDRATVRLGDPSVPSAGPSGHDGFDPANIGKARELIVKYGRTADPNDLAEAKKVITAIEGLLPEKGPYVEAWKNLSSEIERNRAASPSGPPGSARRGDASASSSTAMKGDMETLMAMVSEREAAVTARNAMGAAKALARKAGASDANVLFHLARYEEGNAEEAFQKNDYSGAKALFRVLERTYALATFQNEDAAGVGALKQYVAGLKTEAAAVKGGDPWLLKMAGETENQAVEFLAAKDLASAGGAFLRAAFLYQKVKDAAPLSPPTAIVVR